jgi:hypothetical protein
MKLIFLLATIFPSFAHHKNMTTIETGFDWNQPTWDKELRYQISQSLPDLEEARDIETWCPTYHLLGEFDRIDVWGTLFVAVAFYESSYNPRNKHLEDSGEWSLGLFQLSTPDEMNWCNHATWNDLFDPINNVRCAVPLMSHLIAKDGVLTAGNNGTTAMGAAKYWSTMRGGTYQGHHVEDIKTKVQQFCAVKNLGEL